MTVKRINLFERLHGVVCLYKPPEVGVKYLATALANRICNVLNEADTQRPANYLEIGVNKTSVSVNVRPSYLDNCLASGPKYQPEDISTAISPIGSRSSGVCLAGINNGIRYLNQFKSHNPVKVLHVKGRLGEATRFLYKNETVMAKAKYTKITRIRIDKMLGVFQAAHQRKIFTEFGIDIQSQSAYELAVEGLLRPLKGDMPTIYSVKCIDFTPPDFTLEMICVRENEDYLLTFVHDLGLGLKTLAHTVGIRCIRYGSFAVQHSLLLKEITLDKLKNNMKMCSKMMTENEAYKSAHLQLLTEKTSSGQNNYNVSS